MTYPVFSPTPGVVIDHSPARSQQYIGSPSLAVLPNGELVASHDLFGPGSTNDTTRVFASCDRGESWQLRAEIRGQWWSTLFVHRGALYLMGTTRENGYCTIRRSEDGGRSWSEPQDENTGLLHADGMYHCAPVPVVLHNGRLWRAMEEYLGPKWGSFRAFMMSIDESADLLKAANWLSTNRIGVEQSWLDGRVGGILEGNAVLLPDGRMADILRVHHPDFDEYTAVMTVSADGRTLSFDMNIDFRHMPGGSKKFTIRYDAQSRRYWSLVNPAGDEDAAQGLRPDQVRNRLSLVCSPDLHTWQVQRVILEHPAVQTVGFQYVDWLFAGEDIIAAVRTAFDEVDGTTAHNMHDANWLTFHRVEQFRK